MQTDMMTLKNLSQHLRDILNHMYVYNNNIIMSAYSIDIRLFYASVPYVWNVVGIHYVWLWTKTCLCH